jgi:hypothetical protein
LQAFHYAPACALLLRVRSSCACVHADFSRRTVLKSRSEASRCDLPTLDIADVTFANIDCQLRLPNLVANPVAEGR